MGYRLKSKFGDKYVSTYNQDTDTVKWADDMDSAAYFTYESDAKDVLRFFSMVTRLLIKIVEEK